MEQYLGLPPDGSAHGPAIDNLIGMVHWLMIVLFVGWGTFYIFTLIRFRKSRQPKADYAGVKSHISNYIEIGVLVVEVILLVGFSIPLWSKRVDAFPAEKDATVVRVVAEQFSWNIHYPGTDGKFGKTSINLIDADNPLGLDRNDPDAKDDITTINQLNLPVGKPVIVYLSTKDVIHSFNLPPYRVKQDAIPGMSIPVWFTPVKTTDQIREELRHKFSISEAMKRAGKLALPEIKNVAITKGGNMEDMMLMKDYANTSGEMLTAKGDHLDTSNVTKLNDAGVSEVAARPASNLDKYVSMEEYKDNTGNTIVAKNETLTEDAVTKLLDAGMNNVMGRQSSNIDPYVVMETYNDKSGGIIVSKGEPLTEEAISKLADAGINEIILAPATPTEIACAQLCGLGHYRMRGYMSVQTPEEFKKWFDEQEAALAPPPVEQTPQDSTATQSN